MCCDPLVCDENITLNRTKKWTNQTIPGLKFSIQHSTRHWGIICDRLFADVTGRYPLVDEIASFLCGNRCRRFFPKSTEFALTFPDTGEKTSVDCCSSGSPYRLIRAWQIAPVCALSPRKAKFTWIHVNSHPISFHYMCIRRNGSVVLMRTFTPG